MTYKPISYKHISSNYDPVNNPEEERWEGLLLPQERLELIADILASIVARMENTEK